MDTKPPEAKTQAPHEPPQTPTSPNPTRLLIIFVSVLREGADGGALNGRTNAGSSRSRRSN